MEIIGIRGLVLEHEAEAVVLGAVVTDLILAAIGVGLWKLAKTILA